MIFDNIVNTLFNPSGIPSSLAITLTVYFAELSVERWLSFEPATVAVIFAEMGDYFFIYVVY